jgi:uncharacterized protein YbjT (DUF2867 family)
MSQPILVTGAAGGLQGATGNRVVQLLIQRGFKVRALVHQVDERSARLRKLGAEVIPGDLLDPDLVRNALQGIKRAYFTYPVNDGLLEATAIFAMAARESSTELVVNMSQLQNTSIAPSFPNLQHRLADQIFDWAHVGALHRTSGIRKGESGFRISEAIERLTGAAPQTLEQFRPAELGVVCRQSAECMIESFGALITATDSNPRTR